METKDGTKTGMKTKVTVTLLVEDFIKLLKEFNATDSIPFTLNYPNDHFDITAPKERILSLFSAMDIISER